ncbi:lipolytic protein G-D-S-L family [Mucilaginibacter sp. HMF5004]|uniref:GDSL-type esterase/lipase family protein n=1 Tax=Mucilaginibacter rivuli TaxID=2857527 RepID=UPI001C5F230F|nr:GDSL-type esterase/lipase family protein [Mucilaginibacter rivuli]MBW4891894.1 lipolytic protein G-D-S-L family [Mucilaginibacter rivuli]
MKYIKIACGLLLFMLCSFTIITKEQRVNVVFIGDSITRGAKLKDPATQAPPYFAAAYLKQQNISVLQFSNQGVSGFTTVDFLPATHTVYNKVRAAADAFYVDKQAQLVFSIMLGTNDSAITGPHGAPVAPADYNHNLKTITDSLLLAYPTCKIVINYPLWYSTNTHNNGAAYNQEGFDRILTYLPEIDKLAAQYNKTNKGHVFVGDKKGYEYFKTNYLTDFWAENGKDGIFYLHPNEKGAAALGNFWGAAIKNIL